MARFLSNSLPFSTQEPRRKGKGGGGGQVGRGLIFNNHLLSVNDQSSVPTFQDPSHMGADKHI